MDKPTNISWEDKQKIEELRSISYNLRTVTNIAIVLLVVQIVDVVSSIILALLVG